MNANREWSRVFQPRRGRRTAASAVVKRTLCERRAAGVENAIAQTNPFSFFVEAEPHSLAARDPELDADFLVLPLDAEFQGNLALEREVLLGISPDLELSIAACRGHEPIALHDAIAEHSVHANSNRPRHFGVSRTPAQTKRLLLAAKEHFAVLNGAPHDAVVCVGWTSLGDNPRNGLLGLIPQEGEEGLTGLRGARAS